MCGIAGILRRNGLAPDDTAAVRRMISAIRHRGPDDLGFWQDEKIALGHCRLAIRDLSSAGAQPFAWRNGRIQVVYNGEIYNHRELVRDLHRAIGFVARTECDTELIPAAYAAWGLEAFDRLEGMFAIALWDCDHQRIVLARDGIGIKPLYIGDSSRGMHFASEIKGILAARGEPIRLAANDVAHMLALGYPAPDRTLIEDIRQLPPGTLHVSDREGSSEHRFWRPRRQPVSAKDIGSATDEFLKVFSRVVADQLVSDVPLGVMQSGGIDSSVVSLSLPKNRTIPLYSVRFDETSHDESTLAAKLAAAAGQPIKWVELAKGQDLIADFKAMVAAVDGQLADSSLLASFQLSRALAGEVKVALSGDGADEFFGGYPTYAASLAGARIAPLLPPATWSSLAQSLQSNMGVSTGRLSRREKLYRFLTGCGSRNPHTAWRHYLPPWKRSDLYGPALKHTLAEDPFAGYADAMSGEGDLFDRCMLADQLYYLPADMLVKVDRASMAHSLEVRVPFLDRRIMDFAATLPRDVMLGGLSGTKLLLRRSLAALGGPASITQGRKKGFNVPMNTLLASGLRPEAERLLDRDADLFTPYLSPDGVRNLWRAHSSGKVDEKYAIWTLLTLGTWLERRVIN